MNVNIVYTGKGKAKRGESVLDRLAQTLADETGWSYTRTPTGTADVTYFICYVEHGERFSDWHLTPVAAWFTHHEAHIPYKHFWWELACNNVDLRLTAARQYLAELSEFGQAGIVRPAVDPQFIIVDRDKNKTPRVGISGFVHPGGRKGEKLVAQLAGSKLGQQIDLTAIGQGWPCNTALLDWEALPAWYNSLDLFLCTSLIEGVPMPPLEALACGVPVVIPAGVGMLDDLPDMPGIIRYKAGDYGDVERAVKRGLESAHDREALRHAVADYNAANWAQGHALAFAQMSLEKSVESDRHGRRGVCYVAYGGPSRECARAAIASFKEHAHGIEVALIGSEGGLGEDLFIQCPDVDIGGRHAKTLIYDLAPKDWQYIGYLDADTQVVADISFLWEALADGWDMLICKNPAKYHVAWQMKRSDNEDECQHTFQQIGTGEVMQLNGGVFAFQRNERTQAFFQAWHREWKMYGKRDQGALLRALFANPLKLYVLENWPWNCVTRYHECEGAVLRHWPMTARRWRGKVIARSDSKAAWAEVERWEKENHK